MDLTELLRTRQLPPGRVIHADEGDGSPAFWLSDGPADAQQYRQLLADHKSSGLWPLLLTASDHDPDRPWADGEVSTDRVTSPDLHDPAALLADWWRSHTEPDPDYPSGDDMGPWRGLAPATEFTHDPDEMACGLAAHLLASAPATRLGLVAAPRGADALAVMGWGGPLNYDNDTAKFAAVLRDWEARFGARVVGLEGYGTLHVSVAAPPQNQEQAERVAAEHFAFCPDNVWQNSRPSTVESYAERLVGCSSWQFWWD